MSVASLHFTCETLFQKHTIVYLERYEFISETRFEAWCLRNVAEAEDTEAKLKSN